MEQHISIERLEQAVNLFGSFDENIHLIETEFGVTVANREGELRVNGEPEDVMVACKALTALLTAVIVCTCGIVGFVGLMIPHFMRAFTGSDYRRLLPGTVLLGGLFLIWADIAARTLGAAGKEIPIGIITSAVGAPVFMFIMLRRAYGFGGRD